MDKSKKLDFVQGKKLGPVDDLREKLSRIEEAYPAMKTMDRQQALNLLHDLDELSGAFEQLEAGGVDLTGEKSRFQSIQSRLNNNAKRLLKKIGGANALARYRAEAALSADHWWWHLDQIVAAQHKGTLKRLGIVASVVVVIGIVLVILFNTVLKPSPEAVARLNAENNAFTAIELEGDFETALAAIEEGLVAVPNDPSLLVFKGVLLENLGREAEAEETFALFAELLDNPVEYHLARAQIYLRTGQFEEAENETHAALELNDQFARGWLMLGQSLELQGRVLEAMQAFEVASELAFENDENEVYVMSRMAMARLTEALPALQLEQQQQATDEPAGE